MILGKLLYKLHKIAVYIEQALIVRKQSWQECPVTSEKYAKSVAFVAPYFVQRDIIPRAPCLAPNEAGGLNKTGNNGCTTNAQKGVQDQVDL